MQDTSRTNFSVTISGADGERPAQFHASRVSQLGLEIEPLSVDRGGVCHPSSTRQPALPPRVRIEIPILFSGTSMMCKWWNEVTDPGKKLSKRTVEISIADSEGASLHGFRLNRAWPCGWGLSPLRKDQNPAALTEYFTFVCEELEEIKFTEAGETIGSIDAPIRELESSVEKRGQQRKDEEGNQSVVGITETEMIGFKGEHLPGNPFWRGSQVSYLNASERQKFKLEVKDGLFRTQNGQLFDTSAGESHWSGHGNAIFVMDKSGDIYASTEHRIGRFHHSSFFAGQPVAYAGEIQVAEGRLLTISNRSGHYQPKKENFLAVSKAIENKGVKMDKVVVDLL